MEKLSNLPVCIFFISKSDKCRALLADQQADGGPQVGNRYPKSRAFLNFIGL